MLEVADVVELMLAGNALADLDSDADLNEAVTCLL